MVRLYLLRLVRSQVSLVLLVTLKYIHFCSFTSRVFFSRSVSDSSSRRGTGVVESVLFGLCLAYHRRRTLLLCDRRSRDDSLDLGEARRHFLHLGHPRLCRSERELGESLPGEGEGWTFYWCCAHRLLRREDRATCRVFLPIWRADRARYLNLRTMARLDLRYTASTCRL